MHLAKEKTRSQYEKKALPVAAHEGKKKRKESRLLSVGIISLYLLFFFLCHLYMQLDEARVRETL
jgi:hypothetical protein